MELPGRIAVVTGAAVHTGRAIARRLAHEGTVVVAAAAPGPHILVNNAGGGGHIEPHFPDATPAEWTALLDLNLRSAMLATQLALDPMNRAGGGAVVNIASVAGLGLADYQSPEYAAAKAGLIRFTSTLAPLHERKNVRVNCIAPDWIATERAQEELRQMSAAERAERPTPVPMEAIAEAALELVRDETAAGKVLALYGTGPAQRLNP
ncbi:MAG TPA: SDR family NAD(P)-dependent oxidoreductase [Thermoleophilaceae bacterium]